MKILVIGASGMAGHVITTHFMDGGHDVHTLTRSAFPMGRNIVCDATDFPRLRQIIQTGNFGALINCVGILNRDAEQRKDIAVLLNGYLPHFLANEARACGARLLHMSTDCVFSGKTGGYVESAFPDGPTFYDRSKAIGEVDDAFHLTFRNSIVGPDIDPDGIGLFNWFMRQSGKLGGYRHVLWSGVTTVVLARAMQKALDCGLSGLYQLSNNTPINKYELLQTFNRHFRGGGLTIDPVDAPRCDKTLINTRTDFDFPVPSYDHMVREMKDWMVSHRHLYKHYDF